MSTGAATSPRPPRVRPDVRFGPARRRADTVVHYVKDPRTGWFYRIGAKEFFVMSRMDGSHTQQEIEDAYARRFGRRLGPDNWRQLLAMLYGRGLLSGGSADTLAELRERADADRNRTQSLLRYRVGLVHPDALFTRLVPHVAGLFRPWFVVPALAAALALAGFVIARAGVLFHDIVTGPARALTGVAALAVVWAIMVLHECAHGLTCKRFGGSVPEIGVMWRFPLVAPYCKCDDVVLFAHRRHQVYTAFAGVFASLVALVPFAVAWPFTAPGGTARAFCATVLLLGTAAALMNLVPFLQLDGYFMVNHAFGLVDLRAETYRFWMRWLRGVLRRSDGGVGGYPRADRYVYVTYGLASAVFTLAVCGTLGASWFVVLRPHIGAVPAALLLTAEAAVIVAVIRYAVRRAEARRPRAGRR